MSKRDEAFRSGLWPAASSSCFTGVCTIGSNNVIDNFVFASMDKVLFGSNNVLGHSGYCATRRFAGGSARRSAW